MNSGRNQSQWVALCSGAVGLSLVGAALSLRSDELVAFAEVAKEDIPHTLPPVAGHAAELPTLSLEQFREGKCGRIWVL